MPPACALEPCGRQGTRGEERGNRHARQRHQQPHAGAATLVTLQERRWLRKGDWEPFVNKPETSLVYVFYFNYIYSFSVVYTLKYHTEMWIQVLFHHNINGSMYNRVCFFFCFFSRTSFKKNVLVNKDEDKLHRHENTSMTHWDQRSPKATYTCNSAVPFPGR